LFAFMKVFVAGCTGVVGRRVVPLLVEAGHEVTGVARTAAKGALLERLGARAVGVDLFDAGEVRQAVRGAGAVCNLATAVPPGFRVFLTSAWRGMDQIRREVSANLVEAALATSTVGRVVQESFAPIYADGGDAWIDETFLMQPARYNRSALDAEAQADRFTREGRVGVILRFGWFYGPGDAVTMQLLDAVRRGWFPLFGRPEGYISWVAHEDAASAVVAALGVPAGTYNVVEDEPARRRELANGIARLIGARPPRFLPGWTTRLGGSVGETVARSLRISNRKLKGASGWAPRYPTALDGLAAIVSAAHGGSVR
jgi:nucleoside-diphosphate-sugar epimerase